MVKFQKEHGCSTFAFKRIIAKSREDGSTPLIKASENVVLFTGNGSVEFFINFPVSCINAAVADHFEMFFRDMPDETSYELHNRKRFFDIGIIFMAVVMEGDKVAIIFVDPGGGNNRTSQIASNVFLAVSGSHLLGLA